MSHEVHAFAGAGESRALLRAMDWAGVGIDPPGTWPEPLRTAVAMVLDASLPMWVCWGPDLSFLYNDSCARLLGAQHPSALLKPLADAWPDASEPWGPALMATLSGSATVLEGVERVVVRDGQPQRTRFQVFLAPLRDTGGGVQGLFGTALETKVPVQALQPRSDGTVPEQLPLSVQCQLATEQQAFRLDLNDRLRPLANPDEVVSTASELLGKRLGVTRVVYAAADEPGETITMRRDWNNGELPSLAGVELRLVDFGPLLAEAVRDGRDLVINDVATDERSASYVDAYTANGVRSFVAIPLLKAGRLRAILSLHDARPHAWTEHEVALAHDMVDRTWAAVESATAAAELRYERDQSQYLFDSMKEGFAVVDRHWTVTRMNAEGLRITQQEARHVIGQGLWSVWPDMKETVLADVYREVKRTGQARVIEVPFTFPDATSGWLEVRAYPLFDHGLALFFRNITARKTSQDELETADRRKDEFLAMLAHELRNPLAPISAAAELLQRAKLDPDQVRKTSQIISRQVRHMTSLVNDLLDVSRVTRGLVELDNEPLDVHQLVNSAIEQVTPLIRSRHHHLTVQLTPHTSVVLGDRKRLVQVVANILNNAAKYTQEGGRITLTTSAHASEVQIEVSDNGAGMTAELVSRAFNLFEQAERTSDRSSGGLGLGLALVKSLVELHNGQVRCESAGPGQGSTFTVCLPRLLEQDIPGPAQQTSGGLPSSTHARRILVVDDNVDAAAMLSMLLEASGHQVWVEHSSQAALERARAVEPQVCLLDIGLPEMDGNELARLLRARPETAGTLLIAVTGYGQANDRQKTQAAGFDHHLVKPIHIEQLEALLDGLGRP